MSDHLKRASDDGKALSASLEEHEKLLVDTAASDDDLAWFEKACPESAEAEEDAYHEEELQEYLSKIPPSDSLDYVADAPDEYAAVAYGNNPDPLPESFDEIADDELGAALEESQAEAVASYESACEDESTDC